MKSTLPTSEIKRRRRERLFILAAGVLMAVLSILEYYLISRPASFPTPTGSNIIIFAVINLNIILVLLLVFLIVRQLVKVIFEDKKRLLGAKLRKKLVLAFIFLSLLPTLMLFFASFQFLRTSLTYWFDIKVERALDNALTVGQTYYQDRVAQLEQSAQTISLAVSLRCIKDSAIDMVCAEEMLTPHPLLPNGSLTKTCSPINSIEIFSPSLKAQLTRTWLPLAGPPPRIPSSNLAKALNEGGLVVQNDNLQNGSLIRVLCPLKGPNGPALAVIAVGNLIPSDINGLLDGIKMGYEDYHQLLLYQNPIKATLLLALFLITLLIIFVSIWLGFRIAKGITEPVQMLAEATHRIAQGDLDFSLETHGRDELSSLVRAFNTMTQDLKEARRRAENASRQLKKSYYEIEQRRRYIEIILQNVAAGVISIDRNGIVTTMNRSAEAILKLKADEIVGMPYHKLLDKDQVNEFEAIRREIASTGKGTLQRPMRIQVKDRYLSLIVSFTVLRDQDGMSHGVVIVFDDLTELEKIQRLAAWREVARRIAHEVKNPLTPIQLSAQRLRKKYMEGLDKEAREVFDACTNTIIKQADELKRLVNEFSNFARMPTIRPRAVRLDALAEEVVALYREAHPAIAFTLKRPDIMPEAVLDPDQIKRAIINLLDNAVASMPDGGSVEVGVFFDSEKREVGVWVADTGTGITPEDRERIFEPYFSKKRGGTGLGLAIVNSIVMDHNGRIKVEDNVPYGTRFTLIFPQQQSIGGHAQEKNTDNR
ncbi:sensor histidine kinase [Dissulfurimicrobium hydrothermale]|uniref:sensor histidine kinase n=1 Tax=Dissulfurimicrobium hydrothermale TaxID=1750598 RepID=UPI001EDC06CD|nr:ATP-binding protein [Dissulfurimicrobium hydrothermale]UKL13786.1 HAMP domain-containing protein [Dissulfurimicrobium hydrothermale]